MRAAIREWVQRVWGVCGGPRSDADLDAELQPLADCCPHGVSSALVIEQGAHHRRGAVPVRALCV